MRADQLEERSPTPPSSTEASSSSTSAALRRRDVGGGGEEGVLLSRHLSFLAGVLSLDSVAAGAAPATHVVASTVQLVLNAVRRRLERCHDDDDDVISHSAAVHAVNVVARVADVTDAAVCEVVQEFTRSFVAGIMDNQLLNQVRL